MNAAHDGVQGNSYGSLPGFEVPLHRSLTEPILLPSSGSEDSVEWAGDTNLLVSAYAAKPDERVLPRIVSVDYADPAKAGVYADPLLYPRADWRDAYRYAADGTPLGWTRVRDGAETVFGPDGARAETGAGGILRYPLVPRPDGTLAVEEQALVGP